MVKNFNTKEQNKFFFISGGKKLRPYGRQDLIKR